ncbi:MAG: hypothetical protein IT204_24050 [Fimbriimonadaceae bacterium]|nr:hypothetical protein [Fimbriimonadaceae bacterium]
MKLALLAGCAVALPGLARGYDPDVPICYDPAGIPAAVARALHPVGLDQTSLAAGIRAAAAPVGASRPADLRALGSGAVRLDLGALIAAAPAALSVTGPRSLAVPPVHLPGPTSPDSVAAGPVPGLTWPAPPKLQPIAVAAPAPVLPPPGAALSAALAPVRLQAGEDTPALRAALTSLPLARVRQELARRRVQPWGDPWSDELVSLLVAPDGSAPPGEPTPRSLALHYAGWLARRGDGRCVAVLEQLLRSGPTPRPPGAVLELELLVVYHRRVQRRAAAAETWLRVGQYSRDAATCANYQIEAARDYHAAGQSAAADGCYAKVPQYGYGWATGLAIFDQAQRLLAAGQLDAADRLLQTRFSGRYADQVEVALESLRARLATARGDRAAALAQHARTVERYRALAQPLRGEGLEGLVADAQAALAQQAALQQAAFTVSADHLDLPACLPPGAPLPTLTITAARPLALQTDLPAAGLTVRLDHQWRTRDLTCQLTLHLDLCSPLPLGPWTAPLQIAVVGQPDTTQLVAVRRAAWRPTEESVR